MHALTPRVWKATRESLSEYCIDFLTEIIPVMKESILASFKEFGNYDDILKKYKLTRRQVDLCMTADPDIDMEDLVILLQSQFPPKHKLRTLLDTVLVTLLKRPAARERPWYENGVADEEMCNVAMHEIDNDFDSADNDFDSTDNDFVSADVTMHEIDSIDNDLPDVAMHDVASDEGVLNDSPMFPMVKKMYTNLIIYQCMIMLLL